ncbi:MAG: MmgE/PrpD family protein [Chloroflexi bacterium]|nr:MmgE/PrpD family protein [Chloroflexota bacterium]
MSITEAVARWITHTSYEDMPPEAIRVAKEANLDCLGVAIAGATQPVGQIAIKYTREAGGAGEAGVIAGGFKTNAANAAFANGILAHAVDFDDTWLPVGHPTCTVFPVLMALGEKLNLSGKKLLEAFVIGLEIHGKVGYPHTVPGFHSTPIFGSLAAAAAAAKLLGLDEWKTRMALGIAASHASGIGKNVGTMTKPYHSGNAAFGGLRAALLAREGFTADPDILDGRRGYAEVFMGAGRWDGEKVVSSLGKPFHVVEPGIGIKKYPTCYLNHRALDAILQLVKAHDIKPQQVAEVKVGVAHEEWLNREDPDFGLRAKFSLQYNMAEAVLRRKITIESFSDEQVHRPEAREMMKRVKLQVDRSIPAEYARSSNPVTIRLQDGRELHNRVDVPHGDWDDPLSQDELLAKYRDNVLRVLPATACERTIELMLNLDKLDSIRELSEVVTRTPARATP